MDTSFFKCTKRTEMGLFAVDEGSRWEILGVRSVKGDLTVVMREINAFEGMVIEIPQSVVAVNFDAIERV